MKDKYLRFALGIPAFCFGIAGWIMLDDILADSSWWLMIIRVVGIITLTYLSLKWLDVPTENITNIVIK